MLEALAAYSLLSYRHVYFRRRASPHTAMDHSFIPVLVVVPATATAFSDMVMPHHHWREVASRDVA
jgi:hypothetical protein